MAFQECQLTSLLLKDFFGPVIASIAHELKWGPKPLKLLSLSVKLPLSTVKQALSIMIHFNFVEYKLSDVNVCEYFLLPENVLLITRYSKFILLMKTRFGREGEALIEELLRSGKLTFTDLIFKIHLSLTKGNNEMSVSILSIKNTALELIENGFIIPVEKVTRDVVPVPIKLPEPKHMYIINAERLKTLQDTSKEMPANEYFWRVNFDRFLVEMRDELIVNAMSRRFDVHAGVVIRHVLKLAHQKSNFWWEKSNAVSMMQIKESIGNNTNEAYALKFMDQYITVMKEDGSGIVAQSIEFPGAVVIWMKQAIENLTSLYISQIIDQKFGFKAARVFRLIQDKKYCELEQIQQLAMLPDKEAKSIAYKLLEENFIQMQELKKPSATSSSGQNKPFFLFYVDLNVLVRMVLTMCYKAVQNVLLRKEEEENKQIHIIEKKMKSDLYVKLLKEQSVSEEQIEDVVDSILTHPEKVILDNVQRMTKKLQMAELQIDETIFVLQMYARYNKTFAPESKLKKKS